MYELVICVENVSIVKLKCLCISKVITTLEYIILLNVWKTCEMKKEEKNLDAHLNALQFLSCTFYKCGIVSNLRLFFYLDAFIKYTLHLNVFT